MAELNKRKGVDLLLKAFNQLSQQQRTVHLMIAGPVQKYDEKYLRQLDEFIEREGLSDSVTFTREKVDNIHEYMQAADIFVLPSSKEGFPIAVIEAMASGLAVVASDIPEIDGNQISDEVDGYLFAKGNDQSLFEVLKLLSADPELRCKIGGFARKRALANWSTSMVDAAYQKLYNEL